MSLTGESGAGDRGLIITRMVVNMGESKQSTIAQFEAFLGASDQVAFTAHAGDTERYADISRVLRRFDYSRRNKRERGVLLAYLRHTSGYSRSQLTRLVRQWEGNRLAPVPLAKRYGVPAAPFCTQVHTWRCRVARGDGPRQRRRVRPGHRASACARLRRLWRCALRATGTLSVSHLYKLRKSAGYHAQRVSFTKTRPVCNPIGVRRAPRPLGRAGFVRIDTVHQGDLDGIKEVYHITCVDAVSQWQVQACVQGISEAFLLPVLFLVMAQFPFEIEGFHSDNGSEYVNGKVALMLEKLRIEQTKSRSRHSNDNALAKSKNASVVRKHMPYSHIPQKYAQPINAFYQKTFNPWLNLHRPCLFATEIISTKGKVIKSYSNKDVKTPLACLAQLNEKGLVRFKTGITLHDLKKQASAETDLVAAQSMQQAKIDLFALFNKPRTQRRA